jgi:ABC-2 type transport system ATP-binding protein
VTKAKDSVDCVLNNRTIIIASHLLDDMEILCDRIALMYNGKLMKIGTPDELKQTFSKYKEIFLETKKAKYEKIIEFIQRRKFDITDIKKEGKKLVIKTKEAESLLSIAQERNFQELT